MDVNGLTPSTPSQPGKKCTSYKVLVDPNIKKNCQKLIRYDGIVPGQMGQQLSVKFVKDPRSRLTRLWRDVEVADLPIPKMKFDKYFVGELPPKQIMFTNLNDNVREPFLRSMVEKFGKVEDITIHRHPKTSKHLGLASVTYTSTRSAKQAAMEMNRTSVMGKIIIVQIDAGGKECQRMVDCLVANKPSTPSSMGSTPRIDPRNGTPMSAQDTPRAHNDPRRLSVERSSSVAADTPASSISSSTPGFMPPETQGSFPAFTEQPVQQFQGIQDPSNPQFQMPEQPPQQDMLMHSMNSVTLQGYEHMQKVYAVQQAAQQAAQQAGYTQQHIEVPHTPTAEMYAQQTPVQVQKGFTMPQTPSVPAVPDPHLLYGHQQHSTAIPQEPPAVNFQATQPYQTQSLNVQGYGAHELPIHNETEMPGYPSSSAADNSKQYQKLDHAQSSKKQNYMARSESHHAHSEDSQDSFQSRSYDSHAGRGQRNSNQSGSKRYDNDRVSKRYDDDRGSKRYEDDRHDHRDDRSKKWDRRDRQDYRSNKRNDRQRYRSQDYSEEDEDGGGYRQKDHRHGNYRSKDSSDRHRFDDSYHRKPYKKDDEEEEHESGRSYRGGFKSREYDKKYSDSRTYRDDQRDRKKPRDFGKEDVVDHFAKWRCPTMKDQEIKPKEESSKFEKWDCPTGKPLPPVPSREINKFDQCHPPSEEPPSISPEEVSPFEEWQCPPGEEPPPGTMPLVLPSQPFPPGVQEEPLPNINADKAAQSDAEETDDFALSLDTRIEKLLKSSQGPMAGFPGIQLEDSGNAGKNSSTTGNTLPPPGTEEPTFSQSEESVRTSDPEANTNYMKPEEQWGRYRQEQPPRTEQVDHQWVPVHLPHSHVPDPIQHPRLDHLKVSSNNGNDAYARQRSSPTPPGAQSASATPPPGKMSQGVELLISKQLAQLRNYDKQIASRDTSPVSDLIRDRSQTSTPGIEDYHQMMHRGAMQYTPMDTAADDDDDKMSLSSLSSGEDTKIVVNVPIPEKKPQTPRVNSMPYPTSQASWNSNLNQRSTNVVNAWAAQMMPPTSAASSQMTPQSQAQTSGYRPNPMFPRGPPPSLPGMAPEATMEAFIESMGLPSSSHNDMPTPAQMMQMMAGLGMPPPSIGPDGLPDFKPEQLANFPGQLNLFNSQDMLPFNMPPGFPAGSMPPWAAAPFMPPIPESLLPSSLDKPLRDPEKELVNEVLKTVIQEMKIIMKKDLNRKMVETKAFKSFETWWDTCQLMAKAKDMMKPKEEEKVHKKPPPAIPSMLESSFSSSFGMEGLGLGLRANMPRMPSFKVKRKPASPPPQDEIGDEDDDVETKDEKRPVTPPVIDEDSDEVSDTEQDEISSQTSEPHVLDRRERAKRARDLIYSSSSDEDEDDEDKDVDVEKDLEEDEDDDEEDEEEDEEEDDEEEDEDEEEEEEDDDEEVEDEVVIKDAAKKKLEKTPSLKGELTANDLDKEEESLDTQESETPSKLTADKPSLSDASDVESDEDWTESSSSSETDSSSSESDSADSDSDEEDTEGKASDAKKTTGDEKEDRLGAFEILVEMATKAKDKLDQSSSDTDKGTLGDMELSDIQAAQSLQALRHASETSEVGEMTAFKGDTSATVEDSSEKTMSGSEGELDVGDYKMMLMKQPKVVLEPLAIVDHTYCQKPTPSPDKEETAPASEELKKQEVLTEKTTNLIPEVKYASLDKEKDKEEKQRQKAEKKKARKRKNELAKILEEEIVIPEPKVQEFKARNYYEEWTLLYEFLRTGVSHEDAYLIRKSYETLLEAGNFPWLSYTHWMAHPLTSSPDPPQAKKKKMDEESRVHLSCSARTEGYYKISNKEKVKYLTKARTYVQESVTDSSALDESTTKKRIEVSRDARSDQRRFIAVLQQQEEQVSALFKFNQLQFRKKDLKFCKSSIHGWGLYAMEPIAADEMVIEYVGESVRQSIADSREKNYERMGIGSSYLFRIDAVTIIDATKSGNLARFINHSCNPNCYAKIITVESQKKIVIYSKQTINVGDEITYDYKFPIEDEKISCLCGATQCRGTLN